MIGCCNVTASNSQSTACRFDTRPIRYHVTNAWAIDFVNTNYASVNKQYRPNLATHAAIALLQFYDSKIAKVIYITTMLTAEVYGL